MSGLYEHMDGQCNRLASRCRCWPADGSASVIFYKYVPASVFNYFDGILLVGVCADFQLVDCLFVILFVAWVWVGNL